ncbi:PQQ-dependent sugar dehydrogenase [Pseudonocardia charpentierae]|uniref:PQQ-dependent sugar dehydrogenase n=1 Tax=Pseudonocardia charpentierae TaxID=3075545 RepID=A0ABU2N926_9PSEU|nr:PQQ-dependent sugar dehydrogenase [Pseudonocardia sp. DSM 45834]MDT0350447.1 PQQ-dependent sugar dehydrogenase [Pseudonocardia sp. DSM 45834]
MRIPARGAARGLTAVAVLALALTACGGTPATPTPFPTAATSSAPGLRVLVTGLEVPWGVAFLPDGAALVTERESARLLRVAPDGAVTPVGTVAGVVAQGEGGLLGVAVSPDFATDRTIVVAYTSAADNRVVRLRVGADGTVDGAAQQVLVSGIVKAGIHNGGAVAFGPDGLLYIGTGDAGRRAPAQDRADLGGKILRVTADGAPAPGNPFGTAVYSLGHRNVQGLAFAPDGTLYAAEFGQNRVDEINRITAGGNYGWPEVEGVGKRSGFTDPLVTWPTADASPSGLAFAGGALYAAGLRGERLWRVPVTGPGVVGTPEALLTGEYGRLRGVAPTTDGTALWTTTSNRDGRGDPAPDDDRILVVPLAP